ncbi:MAG TPA: ASPIC/UnbV domain-containing protein, partial [Isosphaeraceae bacterium]|nr:ASPIC/UnbV domain-containing protein [Isosphaeraceae bacterium]
SSGRTQTAWRLGGGSFLSAGDDRLHFGLGAGEPSATVEVRWPSGRVDRHEGLNGAAYRIVEGQPRAEPLPGWSAIR